jgi:hypothetical protein
MNTNIKTKKSKARAGLPLFYQDPQVLRFGEHRTLGLMAADGYAFTADAPAVPLGAGELMPAVRHYPIVFTNGAEPMPLAVIGIQQRNLQLEADGKSWRAGHYIPAYVRRYPFIIADTPDPDQHLLAVDMPSARVVDTAAVQGDRFFDADGTASPMAAQAMALSRAYHEDHARSKAFAQALQAQGLLTDQKVAFTLASGERLVLDGFKGIDRVAFQQLPAHTLLAWRDAHWLDWIALHMASQQNWQLLIDRHVAMAMAAPKPPARRKPVKSSVIDAELLVSVP